MPPRVQKRGPQSAARTRITKTKTTIKENETDPATVNTKSTGPYDPAFEQNLIDGGVYPNSFRFKGRGPVKPSNWEEIKQRLAQLRSSLSPSNFSQEEYQKFVLEVGDAKLESMVIKTLIPIIEGEIAAGVYSSTGVPFRNLDPLTDGTIVPGNPDLYDGARPVHLDERVRAELSGHIIPTTEQHLPIAPNFFLEVKGPGGKADVAERQTCYNGALGARGMHSLQSYGQDRPVYDNCAYTITSTYHNGLLILYTSHPVQPTKPGKTPEIYMNQIGGWFLKHNVETFQQGVAAFRNARVWARDQRDEAIRRANARVNDSQAGLRADDERVTAHVLSEESRTSPNELRNTIANLPGYETVKDESSAPVKPFE